MTNGKNRSKAGPPCAGLTEILISRAPLRGEHNGTPSGVTRKELVTPTEAGEDYVQSLG